MRISGWNIRMSQSGQDKSDKSRTFSALNLFGPTIFLEPKLLLALPEQLIQSNITKAEHFSPSVLL